MVTPYGEGESKGEQVRQMFNNIAPTYDRLNRIISLGLDVCWRKKAIKLLKPYDPKEILDIATGTGDLAIDLVEQVGGVRSVLGVDISEEMMRIGEEKVRAQGLDSKISFAREDSTNMSFSDESFDGVTIGFGIRNFEDIPKALREIHRVLRSSKPLIILELTEPRNWLARLGYKLYAGGLVPLLGRLIAGDSDAYAYLPRSIAASPQREDMIKLIREAGFSEAYCRSLFPGTCAIYVAIK